MLLTSAIQDLHSIWKEMVRIFIYLQNSKHQMNVSFSQGWRGSVKARHFVLALHDYFHEKYGETRNPDAMDHLRSPSPALSETGSDVTNDLNPSLTSAFADNHKEKSR
jgi:hypothetical protein